MKFPEMERRRAKRAEILENYPTHMGATPAWADRLILWGETPAGIHTYTLRVISLTVPVMIWDPAEDRCPRPEGWTR